MCESSKQPAHKRAVKGSRGAFAAHIAERDDGEIALFEKVVDIPADLACGAKPDRQLQTRYRWGFTRKQYRLQLARGLQVFIHALFANCNLFVQPRILHRTRDLRSQQRQQPRVVLSEEADTVAFYIQHSHYAVLHDQRNGEFGTDVGVRGNITRVRKGVHHANRLARFRGRARNAFADWDIIQVDSLIVASAEPMPQYLPFRVHQQNTERIVADQRMNDFCNLVQQFVQREDGAELLRNRLQGAQSFVLP